MDLTMLVAFVAILLVMIPVAGLTLGLTLRFAVRPFMDELTGAMRELGSGGTDSEVLPNEVETLRAEVVKLREMRVFDEKLLQR